MDGTGLHSRLHGRRLNRWPEAPGSPCRAQSYSLTNTIVGFLGAISSNTIGGWLGDVFGRKRVYQYDLLLYAFGALWLVFSVNLPMLVIGYFIMEIAVGAGVALASGPTWSGSSAR